MLVDASLRRRAREGPDRPALIGDERSITFGQLDDLVDRMTAWLAATVAPGARVGVVGDNSIEYVALYYAASRSGRELTLLNQRLEPSEVVALADRARCEIVVGDDASLAGCRRLAPKGRWIDWRQAPWAGPHPRPERSPPEAARTVDDTAWLIFTSGTTGRPKAVPLSHRNLSAAVAASHRGRPIEPGDVYLFPFPLCHVAGYNVLAQLAAGVPVVLPDRFDTDRTLAQIDRHSVTTMSLAPTMITRLLDATDGDQAPLASVRQIGYGAAALPPAVREHLQHRWPGDLIGGYGMTELAGNAAFLGAAEHRRMAAGDTDLLGATGRADPGVRIRIIDDARRDVALGDEGEMAVRGDQVMAGYDDDPAATDAAFTDGWFRTGDIATVDATGMLRVVDRRKDLVITGGENVSSLEVENVLREHPLVRDAAVVGVPDDEWGEVVSAVVVPTRPGAVDATELIEWSRGRLAGFKRPRRVDLVDDLPVNASGKVLKRRLRDEFNR